MAVLGRRDSRRAASRRLGTLAACALVLGLVASEASASEVSARVAQSTDSVTDYWTQARMDAAKPASELVADTIFPDLQAGLEGVLGGAAAERNPRATAIGNESARKVRTHGKVFLTLGGTDYVCSGTVIRSFIRRLVLTAGHCVHEFGAGFATNFMFVPAYDNGSKPFGEWTARRLATTRQWADGEDLRYDVGIAKIRARSGERLQNVVGGRAIALNRERSQFFQAYGYPATGAFNGEQLYRCDSQYQGTDSGMGQPAPSRIACDMTAGSSGGGWVINDRAVNSVVSYGYECVGVIIPLPCSNPEAGKLFGPYFGDTVADLYKSQRGKKRKRKRR